MYGVLTSTLRPLHVMEPADHRSWRLVAALFLLAAVLADCSPRPIIRSGVAATRSLPTDSVFRFAIYGDTRDNHAVHQDIVGKVLSFTPAFVLQTGDLVHDGDALDQWVKFDEITFALRRRVPYCPVPGNHDLGEHNYFEERVAQCFGVGKRPYYSFEYHGVHFIGIDTEMALDTTSKQYRWLRADLAEARAAGRFIVPFLHKAIVSVGPHAFDKDVRALRLVLHPLFLQFGITVVFQGHDHQYYRTRLDGITYVVTAGGGAPLYNANVLPEARDVFEKAYHFCIADVEPTRLAVTVYRQSLSRLDHFELPIVPTLELDAGTSRSPGSRR
jgi:3',5'-cyclic AMP phosphodiesterase CpdA